MNKKHLLFSIGVIFIGVLVIPKITNNCVFAQGIKCSPIKIDDKDLPKGWIENDRGMVLLGNFFRLHQYKDCPTHNIGFWYNSNFDCLIGDQGSGPSDEERKITNLPHDLYYKHFTPLDGIELLPENIKRLIGIADFENSVTTFDLKEEIIKKIREELIKQVNLNPQKWSDKSFDSLFLGLIEGRDGEYVKSAVMMVHPMIEKPLTANISTKSRVEKLYLPFVQEATGQSINSTELTYLYEAALYRCGDGAEGGDQSGRGVWRQFGKYLAVVEFWPGSSENGLFSGFHDCRIHVLRRND